jgi:hypothetical protein
MTTEFETITQPQEHPASASCGLLDHQLLISNGFMVQILD